VVLLAKKQSQEKRRRILAAVPKKRWTRKGFGMSLFRGLKTGARNLTLERPLEQRYSEVARQKKFGLESGWIRKESRVDEEIVSG